MKRIANHSPENLDEARTSAGLSLPENYGAAGICSGVNLFSRCGLKLEMLNHHAIIRT
ncbi:MAG: hypothetical protein F6K24_12030 [Okeania sp. SIO2D1]|nr:hypothetical protein [Okeania sp. SIO2D1]